MPFIFPKRFLRPRDVLDPTEFNQDTEPVQALLDGELDRHNFRGTSLKNGIKLHPDDDDIRGDTNVSLAEGAYFTSAYASVEIPAVFMHFPVVTDSDDSITADHWINVSRTTPNFVEPTGNTFRDPALFVGLDKYDNYENNKPSIIPNHGAWDAVKNSDLSDAMKITVTSGQANLYINAFVQYIWQGFYEKKVPWKYEGPDADSTKMGWNSFYGEQLPEAEANCLNNNGPTSTWLFWDKETTGNFYLTGYKKSDTGVFTWLSDAGIVPTYTVNPYCDDPLTFPSVVDASYSYPLNELVSAQDELRNPQWGGYHHISKGFYPALVQFALRVDGKIIDETITGKDYSFEESAHGLRIEDSKAFSSQVLNEDGETFTETNYVSGQRAFNFEMNYGITKGYDSTEQGTNLPGQKLRTSRAAACGPEVLPVRLGAVVPVGPGTHTVEIVARRLQRKRQKFEYGDFVGVFSRRLHAMVLPVSPKQSDSANSIPSVNTKTLQTENLIERDEEVLKFENLRNRINNLQPSDLKKRSLPNTHLPSKVKYWNSVGWSPQFNTKNNRVMDTVIGGGSIGNSRFPGYRHQTYIDKRTYGTWYNDVRYENPDGKWFGLGWQLLSGNVTTGSLRISSGEGNLHLAANEELLIFAEVEVRNLIPQGRSNISKTFLDHIATSTTFTSFIIHNYISFMVEHKYLDLFGLIAIGYRTGSDEDENWTIASKYAPAVINSSNWTNRDKSYITEFSDLVVEFPMHEGGDFATDGSDYSFTSGDSYKKDLRGSHTYPSNLGITVPLFLRLTRDDFATDASAELTEIALFASTTYPSDWDSRETNKYKVPEAFGEGVGGRELVSPSYEMESDTTRGSGERICHNAWISPYYGRSIIDSVQFNFGRGRLTVLKLVK